MPQEETVEKKQLHWTYLQDLLRCGEKFRLKRIEGVYEPSTVRLISGRAVHRFAKTALNDGLPDKKEEWAKDVTRTAFESIWGGEDEVRPDNGSTIKASKALGVDRALACSLAWIDEVLPTIGKAEAVEWPWVLKCGGYPFDLSGTIDLVDLGEYGESVRDLKTKTKSPNKNEANESDQLTLYAFARSQHTKKNVASVGLDCLVALKGGVKYVKQVSGRDRMDYQLFLRIFEAACKTIEAGIYLPCQHSDWWCSPIYCGYYNSHCRYRSKQHG